MNKINRIEVWKKDKKWLEIESNLLEWRALERFAYIFFKGHAKWVKVSANFDELCVFDFLLFRAPRIQFNWKWNGNLINEPPIMGVVRSCCMKTKTFTIITLQKMCKWNNERWGNDHRFVSLFMFIKSIERLLCKSQFVSISGYTRGYLVYDSFVTVLLLLPIRAQTIQKEGEREREIMQNDRWLSFQNRWW